MIFRFFSSRWFVALTGLAFLVGLATTGAGRVAECSALQVVGGALFLVNALLIVGFGLMYRLPGHFLGFRIKPRDKLLDDLIRDGRGVRIAVEKGYLELPYSLARPRDWYRQVLFFVDRYAVEFSDEIRRVGAKGGVASTQQIVGSLEAELDVLKAIKREKGWG